MRSPTRKRTSSTINTPFSMRTSGIRFWSSMAMEAEDEEDDDAAANCLAVSM